MPSGSVVVLARASPGARLVADALAREVSLGGIVVEDRALEAPTNLASRARAAANAVLGPRGLALARAVRQLLLRSPLERRVARLERQLEARAFADLARAAPPWPDGVPRHVCGDFNHPSAVEFCRDVAPALLVIFGGSIVREPMLAVPRLGVLNTHTSLLPDFRGSFPEFWLIHHQRLDRAGITIHWVEPRQRVDRGDIVAQVPVNARADTDPFELRVQCVQLAARVLPGVVRSVIEGRASRTPQPPSTTPTFRARDVTLAARIEVLRRGGHLR